MGNGNSELRKKRQQRMLEHLELSSGYKITRADMAAAFEKAYPMGTDSTRNSYIDSINRQLEKIGHWVADDHQEYVWRRTNLEEHLPQLAARLEYHDEFRQREDGTWWHHSRNPEYEPHPGFTQIDHEGEWMTVQEHADLQFARLERATPENER